MRLGGWSILMLSCLGRTPPHSYSCCIYVVEEQGRWLLSHISDCRSPLHLGAAPSPAGQTAPVLSDLIPIEAAIRKPHPQAVKPYLNCLRSYHWCHISSLPAHYHRTWLPVIMFAVFCVWWILSKIFQPVQNSFQRQQTIKHKAKFLSQTTNLLFTLKLESHWGNDRCWATGWHVTQSPD